MGKKNSQETLADETDKLVNSIFEQGIDGIIAGFPCQDLSIGNQNATGLVGERSGLFWRLVDTVRLVRPKRILLENVAALFQRKWKKDMGRIFGALASIGYNIEWDCVSASIAGAPHHRARAYILAHTNGDRLQRHFPKEIQRQPEFSWCASFRTIEDLPKRSVLYESQLSRGGNGASKRLHGIGNGNPPCIIRELTKGLK